jgi:hypothetical protein
VLASGEVARQVEEEQLPVRHRVGVPDRAGRGGLPGRRGAFLAEQAGEEQLLAVPVRLQDADAVLLGAAQCGVAPAQPAHTLAAQGQDPGAAGHGATVVKRRCQPRQPSHSQLVWRVTPQARQSWQLPGSGGAKRWQCSHSPLE